MGWSFRQISDGLKWLSAKNGAEYQRRADLYMAKTQWGVKPI